MPTKNRYRVDQKASAALASALMDLPDSWVMCRDMKHAWDVAENFHVTSRVVHGSTQQVIARILQCVRCETQRHEIYLQASFGLDKIAQHYTYEEGYQLKGIPRGNKPQAIVQQEQYRRALESVAKNARAQHV